MSNTPVTLALGLALAAATAADAPPLDGFDERVEAFNIASLNAPIDGLPTVTELDRPLAAFGEHLIALMLARRCDLGLTIWRQTGLLRLVLPSIAELDQDGRIAKSGQAFHKDNIAHTFVVAAQTPARIVPRLAALCHDIAKPSTRQITDGKVTFQNHEYIGGKLARKELRGLGIDAEIVDAAALLVGLSGRSGGFLEQAWTDSAVRRLVKDAKGQIDDLLDLVAADTTSRKTATRDRVAAEVRALRERIADVAKLDAKRALRPALTGDEIMEVLGVGPGRTVGEAYRHLLKMAEDGIELTRDEAVAAIERFRPVAS